MDTDNTANMQYTMNDLLPALLPKFAEQGLYSSIQCKLMNDLSTKLPEINKECAKGNILESIDLDERIVELKGRQVVELYLKYNIIPQKIPFLYKIAQ